MKNYVLTFFTCLLFAVLGNATICPDAQVIPSDAQFPYTITQITCGTTNDIYQGNVNLPSGTSYLNGLESVIVWTPSTTFSNVQLIYTGQTWSGIFVFEGCPNDGGTFIAGLTNTSSSKVLNLNAFNTNAINLTSPSTGPGNVNLLEGVTYYIVIDTYPSPVSPCPGSLTINAEVLVDCNANFDDLEIATSAPGFCTSTSLTLSLHYNSYPVALEDVLVQWQEFDNSLSTWVDIPGETSATLVLNQDQDSQYKVVVSCQGEQITELGPIALEVLGFLDCYCNINITNAGDYAISNFALSNLDNPSDCAETANGDGSVAGIYYNYTDLPPINLYQDAQQFVQVDLAYCDLESNLVNNLKVFIDYNQDGIFDPVSELVAAGSGNGLYSLQGVITVPLDAQLGLTRLRVVQIQGGTLNGVNSCGNYTNGTYQDYSVVIHEPQSCIQVENLFQYNATTNSISFAWEGESDALGYVVHYYPTDTPEDLIVVEVNGQAYIDLENLLPETSYRILIQQICSGEDSSLFSPPYTFFTNGQGIFKVYDLSCGPGFETIIDEEEAINLQMGDETVRTLILPFPIYYEGVQYDTAYIGANGAIRLDPVTSILFTIVPNVPSLAVYQQDLNPASVYSNNVFAFVRGEAPNRQLIIEYNNVVEYAGSGTGVTAQVLYEENTREIYFLYDNVIHGNANNDYGANAEIGATGTQNIIISMNNPSFLQNNSCIRFFYSECPILDGVQALNITHNSVDLVWSTQSNLHGPYHIEFGPAGFQVGTGIIVDQIENLNYHLSNLEGNTEYDVYVTPYCPNNYFGVSSKYTFLTQPNCSVPSDLQAETFENQIDLEWSWVQALHPVEEFILTYTNSYGALVSTVHTSSSETSFTLIDTALMNSGIYTFQIQAVCQLETFDPVGPFIFRMPLINDDVCDAQFLPVDGINRHFSGQGATVQPGETVLQQPATGAQATNGWLNPNITHSVWYKFTTPESGKVRFNGTALNVDGQMAIYDAENCADFATFTFLAGNDDAIGGGSLAPNFNWCELEPNHTYYLIHDPYSTSAALNQFNIRLEDSGLTTSGEALEAATICAGDEIDLNTLIINNSDGGSWQAQNDLIDVSTGFFDSQDLAYNLFEFYYMIADGCHFASTAVHVQLTPPSFAGEGGTITACKNEPINLLSGLNGTVDMGGTWYDPQSNALENSSITTGNLGYQANYLYVVSNGVCPEDSTSIAIHVSNTCDYLSVIELVDGNFELYPNPTDGFVFLDYKEANSIYLDYQILDVKGRIIRQEDRYTSEQYQAQIDLSSLEPGAYTLLAKSGGKRGVFRIILH